MKPGICVLCKKPCTEENLPERGDYVKFSDYKTPEPHSLIDPGGMEYFCDEHVALAKALSTLSSTKALAEIHDKYGPIPEYVSEQKNGLFKRLLSILKDI